MQDRAKAILQKIKDFWLKFNKKQRVLFVTIFIVVVVLIIVLSSVLSKPEKVILRECTSASEASEVRTLLTDNSIECSVDEDFIIKINREDLVNAKLVLGTNSISADGYSINDALSDSLTTTESDKQKKYIAYLQSKFASDLQAIDGVKKARVNINYKDVDNSIFSENKLAQVTAVLDTTKTLSDETCTAIGMLLATNVGSDNNNVFVMSTTGEILYSDGTSKTQGSTASQKVKNQLENAISSKITAILLETGLYSSIQVAPNLLVDFDDVTIVDKNYKAPEGTDEGLMSKKYEVNSQGAISDVGGIAGTESNDSDTSYYIPNANGSTSKYSVIDYAFLQDEIITTTKKAEGSIKYDDSSLSVVATKMNVIYEEDAEAQGLLGEMTWEEYKKANEAPTELPVDDSIKNLIATGTGIPIKNISVLGWTKNLFYDKEEGEGSTFFIIQIALAILIAALLVFIIIKSTKPVAVEEAEPELSVEEMLASTKENTKELDDIAMQEKSEARKAIEKFVDENPEAVALLLRNWLNEGWS